MVSTGAKIDVKKMREDDWSISCLRKRGMILM
jgi:hypothetical protein